MNELFNIMFEGLTLADGEKALLLLFIFEYVITTCCGIFESIGQLGK